MIVLGIDPGLSGALAFLSDAGALRVHDIPTFALSRGGKNKREIDASGLALLINTQIDNAAGHAFIEGVHSMPGQGVSSAFAFGKTYGVILGVLAARGVPITIVAPRAWKKTLNVPAAKDGARARASQLMPGYASFWCRAKDDGRAEAALIAMWGLNTINQLGRAA